MKIITKFTLLGLFILVIKLMTVSCFAQDMHFSQFTSTPLSINPSQAGNLNEDMRIIINYRDQWRSIITQPYKTFGASFDMSFKKMENSYFGGGISVYSDHAGEINLGQTTLNLSIAYHQKLADNSYLSAGLQGGFIQCGLDESQMRFDNQFDGTGHNEAISSGEIFNTFSFFKPDFAAGILYSYSDVNASVGNFNEKRVNIGMSVNHISSPDYSFLEQNFDNLALRYMIHTNSSFTIDGTYIAIQPSGFIAYQRKAMEFLIGSYFRYSLKEISKYAPFSKGAALGVGIHYRVGDAIIPGVLLEIDSLAIGMSYDVNISTLTTVSNGRGGFEISIRYISPNPFANEKHQPRFY